jgi:hypothetical protein
MAAGARTAPCRSENALNETPATTVDIYLILPGRTPGVCARCGSTGPDVQTCVDPWWFYEDLPWTEPRCAVCFNQLASRDTHSVMQSFRI